MKINFMCYSDGKMKYKTLKYYNKTDDMILSVDMSDQILKKSCVM